MVSTAFGYYRYKLSDPITIDGKGEIIEILPGQSFNAVVRQLVVQDLIEHDWVIKLYGRLSGLSGKIKAGEYQLEGSITIPQLVEIFVEGRSIQYSITFVEGWTFKEMLGEIARHDKLKKVLENKTPEQLIKMFSDSYQHPEGLFFPDTYSYHKSDTDLSILQRSFSRMKKVLEEEWGQRAKELPISTPYEALVLASIVEKETGEASEREQIAGVFIRRLQRGMRLQTDPTVIYGLGDQYNGNITKAHLKQYTPYNTYRINGLPPTPIALAGREAIHAALNPDSGNSLYFVAKGDGSHHFSKTLQEHVNAVNRYQVYQRSKKYRSSK